ncbi:hypothetical protein EF405_07915 [Cyclobacteriaceae bacterium YHN15]|jgi:hypothetical protein|nr:hypothetical protein EF405_07915 [Cyclobacteriaceae bacterium YHN15]
MTMLNQFKKVLKSIEPAVMLLSGTYLLIQAIQKKNIPMGAAGGVLVFRGGLDLGKVVEESGIKEAIEKRAD